jgi:DNA polymerase-3 subunit delta
MAASATLETCLEEARAGKPRPVYLLDGDAFLALRSARELSAALVPESARALNVVELDAAASPAEVAAEVSTGGLFGGGKVVLVQEPAFLTSRDDLDDAFARAQEQWGKGAQRDAARRLLALAAKAGWSAQDLAAPGELPPPKREKELARFHKDLGLSADRPLSGAAGDFVVAAARFAIERDMKVARDDTSALEAALARGFPPGHVLVIAAGKVDGKLPLVKALAAAGRRLMVGFENAAKPWEAPRLVLGPVLEALLAGTGKRVDARGEARLAELVGGDARQLASEVQKLAAYVGDRKVIGAADVDEVVSRVASDPFFALGNAVEARDLAGALTVLDRSIADGATPYMVVGSLAATLRRMIVERERARRAVGERRIGSARDWEAQVFPLVPDEEAKGKKPFGFWMKYQAAMRFSRAELLDALAALAEADVAMKSGQDGRLALERVLVALLASSESGLPQPPRSGA